MRLQQWLQELRACPPAQEWAEAYGVNYARAWYECPDGSWSLWILARTSTSKPWSEGRKPLVVACLDCVLLVENLWPGDQRAQMAAAVQVIRRWTEGTATKAEVEKATDDLADAATAAAWHTTSVAEAAAAAWHTADAVEAAAAVVWHTTPAAEAAAAAWHTAYAVEAAWRDAAAWHTTCAVNAVADATYVSDGTTAHKDTLKKCADLVRARFPWEVVRQSLPATMRD